MIGKIDAVRGTVIEVQFQERLPAIGAALQVPSGGPVGNRSGAFA
jgi:hypothetical protein